MLFKICKKKKISTHQLQNPVVYENLEPNNLNVLSNTIPYIPKRGKFSINFPKMHQGMRIAKKNYKNRVEPLRTPNCPLRILTRGSK